MQREVQRWCQAKMRCTWRASMIVHCWNSSVVWCIPLRWRMPTYTTTKCLIRLELKHYLLWLCRLNLDVQTALRSSEPIWETRHLTGVMKLASTKLSSKSTIKMRTRILWWIVVPTAHLRMAMMNMRLDMLRMMLDVMHMRRLWGYDTFIVILLVIIICRLLVRCL